jgi:hypothetical protein
MNVPKTRPGFLERVFRESTKKVLMMILSDQDFIRDMMDAFSLEDYIMYITEKRRRTAVETIFFLLPKEEQKVVWETIKGGSNVGPS